MNKIISWISGLGKIWTVAHKFINGNKTYALGAVTTLQGFVGILDELAAISPTDPSSVVAFVRDLGNNPDWKMILAGIAMFTVRHAIAKAAPDKLGEA